MRTFKWFLFATVFVGVCPVVAFAQGDRPAKAAWFCHSKPDVNPVYVSSVWEKVETQDEITLEFKKYLTAKFGYSGIVMCGGATSSANTNALAVEEKTKAGQIAAWQKAGMKIVETGWNTSMPKAGPPTVNWSACGATILAAGGRQNQGPFETYVSAPFDAGDSTIQAQEAAFEQFLRSKYSIKTTDLHPQCAAAGDEEQALRSIKYWSDRVRANGKVFETGWKFAK